MIRTNMIRTTLQSRLIVLMIISSVFLISAFTAIQLNNQLQRAAEFNLYKARLAALIVKDKLQNLFSGLSPAAPPSVALTEINKIFCSLAESGTVEKAALLDKEGLVVLSEGEKESAGGYDRLILDRISEVKDKSRWLFPFVNKKERLVNLFVIIDNPYGYMTKLTFSLGNLKEALGEVYTPVIFTVGIVVLGNIILATLLSKTLIKPVKTLNQATKNIAGGDLEQKISIRTQDELEELADTFNYMTVELKKMKAKAENANPLTKLPGNIVIQEEVEKRIKKDDKFALLYCDLDNFKAFNDKYGVHAGDEAIMLTADIFKEAMAKEGKDEDFIGHEGGDDFLLLTAPDRAERLGYYIIEEFDKRVAKLYSGEDAKRGYIEGQSRETGETVKFPIMTISMAGVTNLEKKVSSYAQLTNIAADVKKAAKGTTDKGSKLLIDRRVVDLGADHRDKNIQAS